MAIRRRLLMGDADLYPIGTDIVKKYIGKNENGQAYLTEGYWINGKGEYEARNGYGASAVYMRINPNYRYRKGNRRLAPIAYYDSDFNWIRNDMINNTTIEDMPAPPSNAAYARFCTLQSPTLWNVVITRIA